MTEVEAGQLKEFLYEKTQDRWKERWHFNRSWIVSGMLFKQMGELINVSRLNRSWIDEDNIAAHDQKHTLTDTCCALGIR